MVSSLDEAVRGDNPLHQIDIPNEETHEQRPRRFSHTTSRALPFLLSLVVVYIYYVYAVLVCSKSFEQISILNSHGCALSSALSCRFIILHTSVQTLR